MGNVIEFRNITKYFPGVKALDDISFTANGGEVLALMGENGAGKSTLLKVLNGDYQQTSGEYLVNGEPCHFNSPREAVAAGIGVIYQERQIMLELTVGENIFLGRLPTGFMGRIKMREVHSRAQAIIDEFGLDMKSTDKVKDLSVAYQQMVEIMKAYSRENLKMIAFDEPTASLSDSEIDSLFRIIRKLKAEGKVIIYVSHRMAEIRQIADRVAIFKDGRFVGDSPMDAITDKELVKKMVGRDLGDVFSGLDRNKTVGDVVLEVKNLSSPFLKDASFQVRAGEVVGFSGLVGAGRTEVVRAIIGADPRTGGKVFLNGKPLNCRTPHDAIVNGVVMVPEDRKLQGIIPRMSVGRNISIGSLDQITNRLGFVNTRREEQIGLEGNRIKIICYVMTSVFAAMAGIILASRMFSGQPAASPNLHFDAITACNLAGVSMVGGVGSIPSVALGVILVQAFNSGLNMAGVSQYWQYVARAALLFGSLAIDFYRQRNRQKKLLADSMKNL